MAVLAVLATLACGGAASGAAEALTRVPAVAALVRGVAAHQPEIRLDLLRLTGETATPAGGTAARILTRSARSGAPILRAQTYVHDRLVAAGLESVGYQVYGSGPADRSVVAEMRGTTRPGEVVVVGAHLDDMPAAGRAPGADDNGASCAALLYLARHLAGRRFARTVRFVFFGGEEIGYLGSGYAARVSRRSGEDVVAMLNADAIGWNGDRTARRRGASPAADRRRVGKPGPLDRDDLRPRAVGLRHRPQRARGG